MTTMQQHARLRHLESLELAQHLLDQAIQLQAEVFEKIKRVNQLTGLELDWKQDLEQVGEVEEMVREGE